MAALKELRLRLSRFWSHLTPSATVAGLWPRFGGPLLTFGAIATFELLSNTRFSIPNPPAVLLMTVVYSAFIGGIRPGLFSAAAAWLYFAYFFSNPDHPFQYSEENIRRVLVWSVATPAMAWMVGALKQHAARIFETDKANAVLRAANEALRQGEARVRRLIESNIIGVFFWDLEGNITEANDAFLQIAGYTRADLERRTLRWTTITPDEYRVADERAMEELRRTGRCAPYEKEYFRSDGKRVPVLIGGAFLEDSRHHGVAFVLDLSERKRAEDRISYLAHHDSLTGLSNRLLLQDRVNQAISQAQRDRHNVALLFIDLDHFKRINDSLGHQVGDRLLQLAAHRLLRCVRKGDSVARLGGDEFVLSLPVVEDVGDAAHVAQKVLDALNMPFAIDGHELHVTGSIGISLYPTDGIDAEALLRAADTAMYHAKDRGRGNYKFFTAALNTAAQQRLTRENQFRQAWASGEIVLYYQPQVDLANGRILGCEALLRWLRPGHEAISCQAFIGIAEESGLILPIGDWALHHACTQLKRWHDAGHTDLRMAVNLSARQFSQPRFQDVIERILDETGLTPAALDLEITETILMQPNEDNLETLEHLHQMGVQLSVDDFGVGYSSLAYLQRFPINALKIDRSFVNDISNDPNDAALITAIVAMAKSLRLRVVAEGVETMEQASFLKAQGCHAAQGFYFCRPVAADALTEMLRAQWTTMGATPLQSGDNSVVTGQP